MNKTGLFSAICLVLSMFSYQPANAFSVEEYKNIKNERTFKFYVAGIGNGFLAYAAALQGEGKATLYCPPVGLALNSDNYIAMLDKAIPELPPELINSKYDIYGIITTTLLGELQSIFPCK